MSSQLFLLNGVLRTLVKPSAVYLARNADNVARHRELICRAASWLPLHEQVRITDIHFPNFSAEWLTCIHRPDKPGDGVILYIPGGAFSIGSPITHRSITSRLSRYSGFPVLAINYRKVPEHPWPAALEDVLSAYEWLLDKGVRGDRIVLAGDSAGGNLTLAALQALRDRRRSMPAAGMCFSPWADLAGRGASMRFNRRADAMVPYHQIRDAARMYANGMALDDPAISPLYGNFSGLPPLLVHAGSSEMLLSDALGVAGTARHAGVNIELEIWRNAPHAFQLFAGWVPQSRQSLLKASAFVRRHFESAVALSPGNFSTAGASQS